VPSINVPEYSFTLDKHFLKHKNPFRRFEKQRLTKLFYTWISDNLRPISIGKDSGLREIFSYFYDLGKFYFSKFIQIKHYLISYCFFSFLFSRRKNAGCPMDLQSLFQSRQTISRCITDQAQIIS
jgi:hypothetical protein